MEPFTDLLQCLFDHIHGLDYCNSLLLTTVTTIENYKETPGSPEWRSTTYRQDLTTRINFILYS